MHGKKPRSLMVGKIKTWVLYPLLGRYEGNKEDKDANKLLIIESNNNKKGN